MFSRNVFLKRRFVGVLFALVFTAPVLAQNYVVDVHGIVCEFCSFGVAKKVKKLDFIDRTAYKKGVKVDIENQAVYLGVRDDAEIDQQALFGAIESGGYKPIKLWRLNDAGEREEVSP